MFEYEMHQVRAAELTRQADAFRLARAAREARKARKAQQASEGHDAEGRVSTHGPRRSRFARVA
ncbi:hypothetical protein [Streptomyces sp. VRA16 Mangrove soil]|uniref:hypothetical protein n=1 Tax=Streptomyces sp. VRA16 Mangrove soil TaxID=2817434 RepID=UPI001A9E84D9|nr:hypothetical protein [Streptomyces sp. VRA16 Mangrove soil]MBO1336351.1 hypothetical protein [Streptomyces sp. VRA16 Mangrove soil]